MVFQFPLIGLFSVATLLF